jgi:hypothetical protein
MTNTTNWDAIEKLYRMGVLSKRDIARQYRISEGTLRKHAKKHGWVQDLTKQVQERARTELLQPEKKPSQATQAEVAETGAAVIVRVVRNHRSEIAAGRLMVTALLQQLKDVATFRDDYQEEIVEFCQKEKSDERRTSMLRAVALPSNVAVLRDLASAMKTLINLEREAFNIGDGNSPEVEEKNKPRTVVLDFDAIHKKRAELASRNL